MLREYFLKNRKMFLPKVTNWSDPQDQWRNERDVSKLNFDEWFFCHPSAYRLMRYGIPSIALIVFGAAATDLFYLGMVEFGIVALILAGLQVHLLIKRMKNRKLLKESKMTYYDLWMRDWEC